VKTRSTNKTRLWAIGAIGFVVVALLPMLMGVTESTPALIA
jgi:hypothetical protein